MSPLITLRLTNILAIVCFVMMIPVSLFGETSDGKNNTEKKVPAKAQVSELELAYQKEFVFLQGQKRLLEQRLKRQKNLQETNAAKLSSDISSLQSQLTQAKVESTKLFQDKQRLEKELENFDAYKQSLDTTIMQAKTSLETLGFKAKGDANAPDEASKEEPVSTTLDHLYKNATKALSSLSLVKRSSGDFFLQDGRKVSGELTFVGQVAAFGKSELGSGGLVPTGQDGFRIWQGPKDSTIPYIDDQSSQMLSAFIFSSADKEILAAKEKTLGDTLLAGGAIGWVILVLGLIAFVVVLFKALYMKRNQTANEQLDKAIESSLQVLDLNEAKAKASALSGSSAKIALLTLNHIHEDPERLENAVSEGYIEEGHKLDRFNTFITVVSAVAPLLGLLGTVTGMISTFDIITVAGAGDPKLLSGGISEALVTTMFGLIVAIPTLLLGNMLSSWSETQKADMEKMILKLTNTFSNNGNKSVGSGQAAEVS
jgi:biopolymer transport protein ExbB